MELETDKVELVQLDWWVLEDKEDKEEDEMEEGEEVEVEQELSANNQNVSLSVPSYPDQWMRYRSLQFQCQWSIFELRISLISYSVLPLMLTRGGGVCT